MKSFHTHLIFFMLLLSSFYAQAKLPECKSINTGYQNNCLGNLQFSDGSIYVGEFRNFTPNGIGTLTFANGIQYSGEFYAGKIHGKGIEYDLSGAVKRSGIWEYGSFVSAFTVDANLFPFISSLLIPLQAKQKEVKAAEEKRILEKTLAENKNFNWSDQVSKTVNTLLRVWLEDGEDITSEIPYPTFPSALKLSQDKWESNKEFEERLKLFRTQRQKEIERLQADYKEKVDKRNTEIQKQLLFRSEKEKQLSSRKLELINQALSFVNLQISPKSASFNPESSILVVEVSINGGKIERYEYPNAPIQIRREAITSVGGLKMTPEFFVNDSGQFGIKALNIVSGGVKVSGAPTQSEAGSQPLRLVSIDVPIASMPALTQQSAMTVDRNQVEQILYRDENESLRKRLEEQRKAQELALAEETRKASTETAKFRAEAEFARNRQRELELQLASTSRTPVNYGKALNAHALVIGNSAYAGSSKLPNPVNDAKSMSSKLQGLGFTVTQALDTDRTKLVSALSQFSRTAVNADITLLFYAGHGVQITGTNYMLPIDLNLNDLSQAPLQGISLNDVVEKYLPGKTKLVFLDACRDNPLMQVASRGVSRGLAPINVSEGTLISYATKDGSVAQDGEGRNSPFTSALLEHIGDPDDIAVVLRKVREKVMKTTGNKQQPWEYGSLTGGALVLSAIKPK
jgi:hypothetical protein